MTILELIASENRPRYRPSKWALFDWLAPLIDGSMLHEIAAADYGYKQDECLLALLTIKHQKKIDLTTSWAPGEMLQLMRWSEPDSPAKGESGGTRGHLMRAFCCTVLLISNSDETRPDYIEEDQATLIQLVNSALELGDEAALLTYQFICWRTAQMRSDKAALPYSALALLILGAVLNKSGEPDTNVLLLAECALVEDNLLHQESLDYFGGEDDEQWQFGSHRDNFRQEVWRETMRRILEEPDKGCSYKDLPALREIVSRFNVNPERYVT